MDDGASGCGEVWVVVRASIKVAIAMTIYLAAMHSLVFNLATSMSDTVVGLVGYRGRRSSANGLRCWDRGSRFRGGTAVS